MEREKLFKVSNIVYVHFQLHTLHSVYIANLTQGWLAGQMFLKRTQIETK